MLDCVSQVSLLCWSGSLSLWIKTLTAFRSTAEESRERDPQSCKLLSSELLVLFCHFMEGQTEVIEIIDDEYGCNDIHNFMISL